MKQSFCQICGRNLGDYYCRNGHINTNIHKTNEYIIEKRVSKQMSLPFEQTSSPRTQNASHEKKTEETLLKGAKKILCLPITWISLLMLFM